MSYFYNQSFTTAQEIPIRSDGIKIESCKNFRFFQHILLEFMHFMTPKSPISPFDSRNPRKTRHRESLRLQRISELQNNEVWDDGYQAFLGMLAAADLIPL